LAIHAPVTATEIATRAQVPADVVASLAAPALQARSWTDCQSAEFVARWHALALAAAQPNPFYESWYLLPSLRALDPAGKVELLVLEQGGALLGLMPIRRSNSYYGYPLPHLRNWVHDNCFCGQPLVAPGMERWFWRASSAFND
jgi:hypothetical protein